MVCVLTYTTTPVDSDKTCCYFDDAMLDDAMIDEATFEDVTRHATGHATADGAMLDDTVTDTFAVIRDRPDSDKR